MADDVILCGQVRKIESDESVVITYKSLEIEQGGILLVSQTSVALHIGVLAERQVDGSSEPALILFQSTRGQDGATGTRDNPNGGDGTAAAAIMSAEITIGATLIGNTGKITIRAQETHNPRRKWRRGRRRDQRARHCHQRSRGGHGALRH